MLTFVKRLLCDGFRTFECDRDLTHLVVLNSKSRVIDQYALKWNYEITGKKKSIDEEEMVETLKGFIIMPPLKPVGNARSQAGAGERGADPLSVAAGGANKT